MSTIGNATPSFICRSVRLSSRDSGANHSREIGPPVPIFSRKREPVHTWGAPPGGILPAIKAASYRRLGGSDESAFLDGLAHRRCALRAWWDDESTRRDLLLKDRNARGPIRSA